VARHNLPKPELEFPFAAYLHFLAGAPDLGYSIEIKFLVVRAFIPLPHRRDSKAGKQECNEQILRLSV